MHSSRRGKQRSDGGGGSSSSSAGRSRSRSPGRRQSPPSAHERDRVQHHRAPTPPTTKGKHTKYDDNDGDAGNDSNATYKSATEFVKSAKPKPPKTAAAAPPVQSSNQPAMSASEKRKLLWAGKKAMPEEEKAQAPPAKTVNQWETTQFAGDADGARKQKFLSLMGLKKPGNAATATSASQDDAPKSIKRQSEVLDDLERQFDAGRSQQNFGRGRGLGY